MAIYADYRGALYIKPVGLVIFAVISLIVVVSTFGGKDPYAIWRAIPWLLGLAAATGLWYLAYTPLGRTDKPTDTIEITPDTVRINRNDFDRRAFRYFSEWDFGAGVRGDHATLRGLSFTHGISDLKTNCTFSPKRLYERIEVVRLLNGALERIPPASDAPAIAADAMRATEDGLIYL